MPSSARVCASITRRMEELGETRGFVLLFGADSGVGTHVHQRGNSALVFAIGELPQDASNGILIVAERKCSGRDTARAALPVGIVEVGSANTHGDVGEAAGDGPVI